MRARTAVRSVLSVAMAASMGAVIACAALPPAVAQTAPGIPRSADGHPDFAGIWSTRWLTPTERPASVKTLVLDKPEAERLKKEILVRADANNPLDPELAAPEGDTLAIVRGEFRSSLIIDPPDGKLPYTAQGREALRGYIGGLDGPEQRMTTERCLGGVAWAPMQIRSASMLHRFVMTPGFIVLHTEAYDETRILPIGAQHQPAAIERPGGDSIARWDGDVLVVDTRNLNPKFAVHGIITVTSPAATILERFEMAGPNEIVYTYTINDPAYYSQPWTGQYSLERTSDEIFEFACHEGNYAMSGMLAGARRTQPSAK